MGAPSSFHGAWPSARWLHARAHRHLIGSLGAGPPAEERPGQRWASCSFLVPFSKAHSVWSTYFPIHDPYVFRGVAALYRDSAAERKATFLHAPGGGFSGRSVPREPPTS